MPSEASFPMWLNAYWHPPQPNERGREYSMRIDGGPRFTGFLTYSGVWQGPDREPLESGSHRIEYVRMVRSSPDD